MSSIDAPASASTAARLTSACSVCASMPSGIVPVAGSIPAVPEQKMRPPATIAWLYGPSAAGAWSVVTACRVIGRLYADGEALVRWLDEPDSSAAVSPRRDDVGRLLRPAGVRVPQRRARARAAVPPRRGAHLLPGERVPPGRVRDRRRDRRADRGPDRELVRPRHDDPRRPGVRGDRR